MENSKRFSQWQLTFNKLMNCNSLNKNTFEKKKNGEKVNYDDASVHFFSSSLESVKWNILMDLFDRISDI